MIERATFPGSSGAELSARVDRPEGEARAWTLFAHGFTLGKDLAAAGTIARALAGEGLGVLRFDFTGLGSSEGEFASTNFSSNVGDLISAARWLEENERGPRLLVGHSLGGAACLAAAHDIASVEAVATIGAPADPSHVEHLFDSHLWEIEERGLADVTIAGQHFPISREFIDDIRSASLLPKVADLDAALLVFHAPRDQVVGIENARQIFEAAKHPKSFISLPDADHLLSARADATYVGKVIAAWVSRYVE